ncbi:ATP-binding protein [Streptomyces sp. NPDC001034]|uniref:ATP-binding protein n=1 Tax=Streptomyces sp. NPDC001034 TaxID=3154375 RepID=UPI003327E514
MAPPSLPRPPHGPPQDAGTDRSPFADGPGPGQGAPCAKGAPSEGGAPLGSGAFHEKTDRSNPEARLTPSAAAFDLPARSRSVGAARRVVRDLLTVWGVPEGARDDTVLVTSELVTNALVHAGGARIGCRLHRTATRIRIEVADEIAGETCAALPVPCRPGPEDQHGRGLLLVEALSLRWGVDLPSDRPARVVWAELRSVQAL